MAYTRTTWVSGETPLSADNMNNIEDGIQEIKNTVGTTYVASTSTSSSVSANGYKKMLTLSLPAGVYVVTGHIQATSVPSNRFAAYVGTMDTPGVANDGIQVHYSSVAYNSNLGLQTTAIVNLTDTTDVKLVCYSGAAVTVNSGILRAVRIK